MMTTTQEINELAAALVAAQNEMPVAKFDATNPHFKNKYATLGTIVETARPVLFKHNLAIAQTFDGDVLVTNLIHKSGQFISSRMNLHLDRDNMQGLGSAVTYARRYSFASIIGLISDEDDDGNAAARTQAAQQKDMTWDQWVIPFGRATRNKKLKDVADKMPEKLPEMLKWMEDRLDPESKFFEQNQQQVEFVRKAMEYVGETDAQAQSEEEDQVPMGELS